ncbi:hypothetical protein BGZ94_004087, partial [Podila epigama]
AFTRVPRPPNEPGKGSYWKIDPNHASSLDPAHGGTGGGSSRSNRTSRKSKSKSVGGTTSGRRATSDPTEHPLSPGSVTSGGGSDLALSPPVPTLPKRASTTSTTGTGARAGPGTGTGVGTGSGTGASMDASDTYLFSPPTAPSQTSSSSIASANNRRTSQLLSHDHDYSSQPFQSYQQPTQQQQQQQQQQRLTQQQQQQQRITHQQQSQYSTHLSSSTFGLTGLHQPSTVHPNSLFGHTPTQGTGGPSSDFNGSTAASLYSNHGSNNPGPDGTSPSSFSRFPNQGLYFLQGPAPGNGSGASSGQGPAVVTGTGASGAAPTMSRAMAMPSNFASASGSTSAYGGAPSGGNSGGYHNGGGSGGSGNSTGGNGSTGGSGYGNNNVVSHPYGGVNQGGGAGASFYGFPTVGRTSTGQGASTNNNSSSSSNNVNNNVNSVSNANSANASNYGTLTAYR